MSGENGNKREGGKLMGQRTDSRVTLLNAACAVSDCFVDVRSFEVGIRLEDFISRASRCEQAEDITDGNAQSANARPSRHHLGIDRDARKMSHGLSRRRRMTNFFAAFVDGQLFVQT